MKVLIWIGCILANALIQTLFGMKLGAIPSVMFFASTMHIASKFASLYENRKSKRSKEYFNAVKGVIIGFVWYGASILYVLLGTIFNSTDPMLFDFTTQIIIAVICIGLAAIVHILLNKYYNLPREIDEEVDSNKLKNQNICTTKYCRKCGIRLEENSRFCHKCGTEIKEEER